MGRYTTVQTYADNNQPTAAVPYEKVTGGGRPSEGAKGGGVRVEAVENVSGSAAGVGSRGFHAYIKEHRREMSRLKAMEEGDVKLTADQEYHARLELNRLEAEDRTRKRAEKRHKRKEKERARGGKRARTEGVRDAGASSFGGGGRGDGSGSEEDSDEEAAEEEEREEEGGKAHGSAGAPAAPAPLASSKP